METDATALYAPSMAQIGLSPASVPPNCCFMGRTLRRSKLLHSHTAGMYPSQAVVWFPLTEPYQMGVEKGQLFQKLAGLPL